MLDVILDTLIDAAKLIPFLFLAYLLMEYLEHKTENKTKELIKKSGKLGPFWGSMLGIFPQCGFSAAAANLYAGRILSMGTLIAVFLSTSDEMLPILISKAAPISLIIRILLIKLIIGIICGFIINFIHNVKKKDMEQENSEDAIGHICEHEKCDCENGIFKSALKHTLNIILFIIIVTFIINALIYFIGEENIKEAISKLPMIGILVITLVGFIPNCAGSVIITELYLTGLIDIGAMIAGLLASSGIGILVLFKNNKHLKENIKIVGILYFIGVVAGLLIDLII